MGLRKAHTDAERPTGEGREGTKVTESSRESSRQEKGDYLEMALEEKPIGLSDA